MDLTNLSAMLERMRRAVAKLPTGGTTTPFLALLKDYVLPGMEEFEAVLQQAAVRLTEIEDLVDEVGDKADAAFIAARDTLAGELFEAVAVNIEAMRIELVRLGLGENQVLMGACSDIEAAVYTFARHLSENEDAGDEEEVEAAGAEVDDGGINVDGDIPDTADTRGVVDPEVRVTDASVSQDHPEEDTVVDKTDAT